MRERICGSRKLHLINLNRPDPQARMGSGCPDRVGAGDRIWKMGDRGLSVPYILSTVSYLLRGGGGVRARPFHDGDGVAVGLGRAVNGEAEF